MEKNDLELLVDESGFIVERLTSGESVRPGCLGRLKGPIAEWKDPTRNDRYYSLKLWQRVFNLPWVKEALETKTLFGEADHPDDRVEPKLLQAAVVLVNYEINESDQTIYGVFDILDTPCGRVLRTLAEYGCKLGVSSRGRGKVVTRNGRKEVDTDSYIFGGFDVVALPAVKKARQDFTLESVEFSTMTESISSQINDCCSTDDLESIRAIIESANLGDQFNSIIDDRMNELKSKDNTIVNGLTNDLKEAYEEISRLKSQIESNSNNTNTFSMEESVDSIELMNHLVKENASYAEVISALKTDLKIKTEALQLAESRFLTPVSNDANEEEISNLTTQVEELRSQLDESDKGSKELESQIESLSGSLFESNSTVDQLKIALREANSRISQLESELSETSEELGTVRNTLDESYNDYNKLVDDFNFLVTENSALTTRYLAQQSSKLGITSESLVKLLPENYTVTDIDNVVKSQLDQKKRFSSLPITKSAFKESYGVADNSESNESISLGDTKQLLMSMKGKK